jgi:hypothetical protein
MARGVGSGAAGGKRRGRRELGTKPSSQDEDGRAAHARRAGMSGLYTAPGRALSRCLAGSLARCLTVAAVLPAPPRIRRHRLVPVAALQWCYLPNLPYTCRVGPAITFVPGLARHSHPLPLPLPLPPAVCPRPPCCSSAPPAATCCASQRCPPATPPSTTTSARTASSA